MTYYSRSGRPSLSIDVQHVEMVYTVINKNCLVSVHEVAEEVGISVGFCHLILTEKLGIQCVSAKLVPLLLTIEGESSCNLSVIALKINKEKTSSRTS